MKLAVIGSGPLRDDAFIRECIWTELQASRPSLIVLAPSSKFNGFIKTLADSWGIPVDEMKPSRFTWLGQADPSTRKDLIRKLYGKYVVDRADEILIFWKKGRPGLTGKFVKEQATLSGKKVREEWF